jgi:hypothetical protein
MSEQTQKVKLKVTPAVAKIVGKDAPRELQLAAARGAVPLQVGELLTTYLFLIHGRDAAIKAEAQKSLKNLPVNILKPVIESEETHPRVLDLVARYRYADLAVMESLLFNPAVEDRILIDLAGRCEGGVLSLIANNDERLIAAPDIIDAILANPLADKVLKFRFGWQEPNAEQPAPEPSMPDQGYTEEEGEIEELEEDNLSKYQQALEFGVSDKIKLALTGDKEWRSIFIKDNNKLVCSAVLKNPRITDGEVLMIAKNRTANEELIRIINLNREWVKNYEIRKALVMNPRTPLPKALRYMATLSDKEIKELAKSKNVSAVIVNNARRMVMAKEKRK